MKCRRKTQSVGEKYEKSKTGRLMLKSKCSTCDSKKSKFVQGKKGVSFDIHKLVGKLPRPKNVCTLPGCRYAGPYNPQEEQLSYDKDGNITEYFAPPANIASQHDVDYSICGNDKKCKSVTDDMRMVKRIDELPYGKVLKSGVLVRNKINAKQELDLGLPKKGKSRRVKKTGKKN